MTLSIRFFNKHKMKKIISVLAFLLITNVYSQTKQETENWILEKLQKYTYKKFDRHSSSSISDRIFSFDGVHLLYSYKLYDYGRTYNRKYIVPVWAIQDIYTSDKTLTFSLSKYCKECKLNESWRVERRKFVTYYVEPKYKGQKKIRKVKTVSNGYEDKYNSSSGFTYFEIEGFSRNPEEDFIARFKKAIKHLQTLYPKQLKKKETF